MKILQITYGLYDHGKIIEKTLPGQSRLEYRVVLVSSLGNTFNKSLNATGENQEGDYSDSSYLVRGTYSTYLRDGTLGIVPLSGAEGIRTITVRRLAERSSQKFYLLNGMVGGTGLEPVTSCV